MNSPNPTAYQITPDKITIQIHSIEDTDISRALHFLLFIGCLTVLGFALYSGMLGSGAKIFVWFGVGAIYAFVAITTHTSHPQVTLARAKRRVRFGGWLTASIDFSDIETIALLPGPANGYHYVLTFRDPPRLPFPLRITADFIPSRDVQPKVHSVLIPAVWKMLFDTEKPEIALPEVERDAGAA